MAAKSPYSIPEASPSGRHAGQKRDFPEIPSMAQLTLDLSTTICPQRAQEKHISYTASNLLLKLPPRRAGSPSSHPAHHTYHSTRSHRHRQSNSTVLPPSFPTIHTYRLPKHTMSTTPPTQPPTGPSEFHTRRAALVAQIGDSLEQVLSQINALNRGLEGIIEIGNEFASVEALWSQFEGVMGPGHVRGAGAGQQGAGGGGEGEEGESVQQGEGEETGLTEEEGR